jgi:hypothetical protein
MVEFDETWLRNENAKWRANPDNAYSDKDRVWLERYLQALRDVLDHHEPVKQSHTVTMSDEVIIQGQTFKKGDEIILDVATGKVSKQQPDKLAEMIDEHERNLIKWAGCLPVPPEILLTPVLIPREINRRIMELEK